MTTDEVTGRCQKSQKSRFHKFAKKKREKKEPAVEMAISEATSA